MLSVKMCHLFYIRNTRHLHIEDIVTLCFMVLTLLMFSCWHTQSSWLSGRCVNTGPVKSLNKSLFFCFWCMLLAKHATLTAKKEQWISFTIVKNELITGTVCIKLGIAYVFVPRSLTHVQKPLLPYYCTQLHSVHTIPLSWGSED